MKIGNINLIKFLVSFILINSILAYFILSMIHPKFRHKNNRVHFSYKKVLLNKTYLEVYLIDLDFIFFKFPTESRAYYMTDSSNYRIYLGTHIYDGYMTKKYDTLKINIKIYNPGSLIFNSDDTYYFKELKQLNNYKY